MNNISTVRPALRYHGAKFRLARMESSTLAIAQTMTPSYTDSAPKKNGAGCGNPTIKGAHRLNPVLCGFFVCKVSSMAGLYGTPSGVPFPLTRFSTPYSSATQPWKVGRQVKTCQRRHIMSNQSIATPVANTFKPFTFHRDISGDQYVYKSFVENIYQINSGMNLMLQIAFQSWLDQDDGDPYLSNNQISNILLAVIGLNNLIESEAEKIIDWQNERDEKKGGN